LRAARANPVFCTDEKRIRTENTVMDKNRGGLDFIQDRRLCTDGFSSVRNRRSARTGRRPRKFCRRSSVYPPAYAYVGARALRAPRANPVFATDEKHIRTENTVIDKSRGAWDCLYT
jgi:hypothetical protein